MCRLRIPGGILNASSSAAWPTSPRISAAATPTSRRGPTCRSARSVRPHAPEVLLRLSELGLTSRGSGADNIRNVTGSPTAGIDPQELIDTRPLARAMHHYILNHREMYGLPRKFNIAFDGGGRVGGLEDTNDIGFSAVRVADGACPPASTSACLGGITGHRDFARETGVLLTPDDAVRGRRRDRARVHRATATAPTARRRG